jgi:hypothetical protein
LELFQVLSGSNSEPLVLIEAMNKYQLTALSTFLAMLMIIATNTFVALPGLPEVISF